MYLLIDFDPLGGELGGDKPFGKIFFTPLGVISPHPSPRVGMDCLSETLVNKADEVSVLKELAV